MHVITVDTVDCTVVPIFVNLGLNYVLSTVMSVSILNDLAKREKDKPLRFYRQVEVLEETPDFQVERPSQIFLLHYHQLI